MQYADSTPFQIEDCYTCHDSLALGASLDAEYASSPNPGSEGLARLNREEYRNAIRDMLQFDASPIVASLPAELAGKGFDNNIELLSVSPTLIDAYASACPPQKFLSRGQLQRILMM